VRVGTLARAAAVAALASGAFAGCRGAGEGEREAASLATFEAEALLRTPRDADLVHSWVASGGRSLDVRADGGDLVFALPPATGAAAPRHAWWRVAAAGRDLVWQLEWRAARSEERAGEPLASRRWRSPARAHADCLDWFDLGPVPDGAVELVARRADAAGMVATGRVDQLALATGGATPDEPRRAWRSDDGTLEVRAGPGARVPDPDWTLKLLRESRAAVAARLGVAVAGPLALIALPGGAAEFEASGGFQHGRALFLRDDELHLPWRGYAHELVHVVEEARGWKLPWVWSEAIASALALDVALRDFTGIEGPGREAARLARLLETGDAWHRPGDAAANLALALERAPDDPELRAAGYSWGAALLRAAAEAGGPEFWQRLAAELDRDAATMPRPFLAALEAAAGAPLDELLRRCGAAPAGVSAGK